MSNQFKLTQKVANTFLLILKNNLVMGKLSESKFSDEFGNKRMQIGDTLTVRRPPAFVVSDGPAFVNQDVVVGSAQIKIDQQKHIGLTYTDLERALSVDDALEDAVLNAKMAALAQQIDMSGMRKTLKFASWVGTPGQKIDSATDFFKMPERLDEFAVPQSDRNGVLSPGDYWATAGSFTSATFFDNDVNRTALEKAKLPVLGTVQPYMSQNVIALMAGTRATTGALVNGANQNVNYSAVKDTYTQSLVIDGLAAGATVKEGEILVIDGCYATNPRQTDMPLDFLRQFVVMSDATANGSGQVTLTISFPIIVPGTGGGSTALTNSAFGTVNAAPADNAPITFLGAPNSVFRQNASFHKTAIQYVFVEPPRPHTGEFSYAQDPETGISIRLWAFSDGNADTHAYRADVIYGVDNLDPRLGTRGSGTA